jgi:hypothetical protein
MADYTSRSDWEGEAVPLRQRCQRWDLTDTRCVPICGAAGYVGSVVVMLPGERPLRYKNIWLQLLVVCVLTSCPTSHTDAQEDLISIVQPAEDTNHADR